MRVCSRDCPICQRPAGRAKFCPYCDEPLPPGREDRRVRVVVSLLALIGIVTAYVSPAGRFLSLAHWPETIAGVALAVALGAVSGLFPGLPLPILLLAADVPTLPFAASSGAYAVCAAWMRSPQEFRLWNMRNRGVSSSGNLDLPEALAGIAWVWYHVTRLMPAFLATLQLLLRKHGGWLLTGAALALALSAKPVDLPRPEGRRDRLCMLIFPPILGVLYGLLGLLIGSRWMACPGNAVPAAVGLFTLGPMIGHGLGFLAGRPIRESDHAFPPAFHAVRMHILLLLLLATSNSSGQAVAGVLAFATAATILYAISVAARRLRIQPPASWLTPLPVLGAIIGMLAVGGIRSLGIASCAAALWLLGCWWRVPVALSLTLWIPWIW